MHNRTGCICLTFLHCASSYVSSKNFGQSRHSHIGCICLIFLRCAFSNVSSNCLNHSMHIHIGCICLSFLHCEFLNVSSNCLPEKRHICIGCICWIFLLHYLCFSRQHLHWPHFHKSHHPWDLDPSPPIRDYCPLVLSVSNWESEDCRWMDNKWKRESLLAQ